MPNIPPHPVGTRFGRLRVESFVINRDGGRVYICQCDCGNVRRVASGKLNAGKSKSCGCLRSDLLKVSKKKWPGNPAINSILAQYKNAARSRKLDWSLSHDEATHLLTQPCYWCGQSPSREVRSRSHSGIVGGIDRRNNDLGYVAGNCVSCCKVCNIAKASLTELEWTGWLERIAAFRNRQTPSKSPHASESSK